MAAPPGLAELPNSMSAQSLDYQPQEDNMVAFDDSSVDNIRVYVRVRPPTEREQVSGNQSIVAVDNATSSLLLRGDPSRTFTFDGALGEDSTQEETFELVGRSIGSSCLAGYNGSIYVYGQTGVGKTYTMSGPVTSVQSMQFDERRGLICRILGLVFAEVHRRRAQSDNNASYLCRCSFLEIYKEQITDLLEPNNTSLQVREDMNRGVYVERLSEPTVWTLTEAFQQLWKGLQQRHIGATHMNERSSRSHAVFTLSVEVARTRAGVTSTRVARLSLVDLAGSERQQGVIDAGNCGTLPYRGERVKEAGAINKSLSALTNVIMSLSREERSRRRSAASSDGPGRRQYVHYRDSKLTFLLRDSLGGNSKTVIIACISPSASCCSETLSTLKFAARAKHIRCAAVRNEEFSGTVEGLMEEVKVLRQQLASLSGRDFNVSQSQSILETMPAVSKGVVEEEDVMPPPEETDVLFSRKRVRRLEVLLRAGLERERHADQRRHQLQRLAEFLEDLDFRKVQDMRRLNREYATLVEQLDEENPVPAQGLEAGELAELVLRLSSFKPLLGNLAGAPAQPAPAPALARTQSLRLEGVGAGAAAGSVPALVEGIANGDGTGRAGLASPGAQTRSVRKRGTSQSMQRGLGERMGSHGALPDAPGTDTTSAGGSGQPSTPTSGGEFSGSGNGGLPGNDFVDEAAFLRDENERLRQQLVEHPEVGRLAAENRSLRARVRALDSMGGMRSGGSWRKGRSLFGGGDHSGSNSSLEDMEGGAAPKDTPTLEAPVTSEMLLRVADVDDDSSLRTWVYCQKMAKEVEELIRARDGLASMLSQARSGEGPLAGRRWPGAAGARGAGAAPRGGGGGSGASAGVSAGAGGRGPDKLVEPRVVEELAQTTNDALQLAQAIIGSRKGSSLPGTSEEDPGRRPAEKASGKMSGMPPSMLSSNFFGRLGFAPRGEGVGSSGGGVDAASAISPNLSEQLGVTPRSDVGERSAHLRQAIQRVKQLHGTLDLVSSTYNDAYDQFQRVREEYENRVEECQFLELQCSRLDMHCQATNLQNAYTVRVLLCVLASAASAPQVSPRGMGLRKLVAAFPCLPCVM